MISSRKDRGRLQLPARIFVYEHISGGGLASGSGFPSLKREGRAMLVSILEDLARLPGIQVVSTVDARLDASGLPGEAVPVASAAEARERFRDLSRRSSGVLVIAPETDGALLRMSQAALDAGALLLGSEPRAVEVTADKLEASRILRRSGVPAVLARPLPERSVEEAVVIKPRDGAGSEEVYYLPAGASPPHGRRDMIVTPYAAGIAASVLFVIGSRGKRPLAPCRQTLSEDGRFRYLGGSAPLDGSLARRAVKLATSAIDCFPGLRGFAGVDLVLSLDDRSPDRVVEVNPRLTASYVGLRRLARNNLADCWLEAWLSGAPGEPFWGEQGIGFSSDGETWPLAVLPRETR